MLLLLDLQDLAILESPLHDIGVNAGALDRLALGEGGPEVGKVLELDHVPDVGEGCGDNGGFRDGGGSWDARHSEASTVLVVELSL